MSVHTPGRPAVHPSGNPARMGRRVWARVIDSTIAVLLAFGGQVAAVMALMGARTGELTVVIFAVLVLWTAFGLWTIFARAALPGQWLLGLHHVDPVTGRRAGARTFLKYLVQGCTFGLALLITPLTIQAPNRSWFDRMAGVMLLDPREPAPPGVAPRRVDAPPPGWHEEESQLTQVGHPPSMSPSGLAPTSAARPPAASPTATPAGGGPMIQSVPFDSGVARVAPPAPPAVDRPAAAVVPPARVTAPVPPTAPVPVITLDSGEVRELTGTTVVGRAPRQSQTLGQATLVAVADPSVSANHVALGVEPDGPWVMDLRSTNGSSVQQDGGVTTPLEPMTRVKLSPGAVVKIGQRSFTVSAR